MAKARWRRVERELVEAGLKVTEARHIFVLRLSLDRGEGGSQIVRVRIEDIESGEVRHFNRIDAAIDLLGGWLQQRAEGCAGGPGSGETAQ